MKRASAAARVVRPIDSGLLAAGARTAANAILGEQDAGKAIEAALESFYDAVAGIMPSVFVLEHGRLWLVAQRGYAVVPDGIAVQSGIMGRAIRLGRAQLAPDVDVDPDYVPALPGIVAELAVPLRSARTLVGVLNVESERALPDGAVEALQPLVRALAPHAETLRASRILDLAALARLFAHLGSLRDPRDIAALGAASLPKVLPSRRPSSSPGTTSARTPSSGRGDPSMRCSLHCRRRRSTSHVNRRTRASSVRCSSSRDPAENEMAGPSSGCRCAPTRVSWVRSSASIARRPTWTPRCWTLRRCSPRTSPLRSTRRFRCSANA